MDLTLLPGVDQLMRVSSELLSSLLGPSFEAAGKSLKVYFQDAQQRNLDALRFKLAETQLRKQIAVEQVELKLMNVAFSYAILEENDDLQQIWANMLLNAGDVRHLVTVSAMYPHILARLGANDVKFINALFEKASKESEAMPVSLNEVPQRNWDHSPLFNLYVELGLNAPGDTEMRDDFWIMLDLFKNQGIIEVVVLENPYSFENRGPYDIGPTHDRLLRKFRITDLGAAFIRACLPPT